MTKSSSSTNTSVNKQAFNGIEIKILFGVLGFILLIALFLWIAGGPDWVAGWLFIGLATCGHSVSALYLWRKNPEMLKSRAKIGKGTKAWDKLVLSLFGTMYVATIVVAALDAGRHQTSGMPFWLWPVGAIMYCFFLIVFCILACAPRTGRFGLSRYDYVYQVPEEIGDGWQTSSLSQANVESIKNNELKTKPSLRLCQPDWEMKITSLK